MAGVGLSSRTKPRSSLIRVLHEVEAVRSRYRCADGAERRDEGADDHGVSPSRRDRDAVLASVLGGEPHESFREASSSVNLLGRERRGMRGRRIHE